MRALNAKIAAALKSQWARLAVDRVVLDLPLPISTNDLWQPIIRSGKPAIIKSKAYRQWIATARAEIERQRPGAVSGRYSLTLVVSRAGTGIDLGNAEKACGDCLQAAGVIDNDRQAETIFLCWSDAVDGMSVVIERLEGA